MWTERRRSRCPGSAVTLLLQRELGYGPQRPTHALAFDRVGEDRAAHYELEETKCSLPPSVRSTFLMAFSPDCTKVASTHGDHRIHVCEVATGRLAHTLEGHPRTPWCLAFHPTSNHILASGCLAGQVRVWDLRGGSEVWSSREGTVISSLAFHPLEPLLAIATANRVVLWDWRKGHALATCKTSSEREKVRFVQFCAPRGDSLVTGITNVDMGGPGPPRVLDPLLGPQVGALRVPPAPVDTGSSQRRSILTRLMSMYQHLEGLEEMVAPTLDPEPEEALQQARNYARDVTSYSTDLQRLNQLYQQQVHHVLTTQGGGPQGVAEDGSSADEEAGLSPGASGSASAAATGPNSRYFWATFYRLRSICSRLERRMQQHQLRSHPPPSSSSLASTMVGRRSGRPPRLRSWVPPHLFGRDGRSRPVPSRSAMTAGTSSGHRTAAASSHAPSSSSAGPSSSSAASSSTSRGPPPALGHPDVSVSLVSLLARLQMSLQSLSSAALTTAVAREQIHQVRVRITEILERLSNVSGYRARLTSLREEIFEAAAAAGRWSSRLDSGPSPWEGVAAESGQPRASSSVAAAAEERHPAAARGGGVRQQEEAGDEATFSQHWDLAYCLWLVEMSLQLTRQMQRILAADYRLTQLHLNATSSTASGGASATTTATTSSSSSPPPLFSPFTSQTSRTRHSSPPQTPPSSASAAASTSRSRASPPAVPSVFSTPPSARRSTECPRLRRHGLRRHRHHRRHYRPFLGNTADHEGSSSSSSDSLDSSDEDDLDFGRMRVDPSPGEEYPTSMQGRGLSAVGGVMGRNRFWPASPPPSGLEEDPSVPELHVSPPSSPPPVRPTAPVPPRPRSPPLPVILSGAAASRGGGAASLDSLWGPPVPSAAYFSLLYDGGFRPRLSFYETGPNLTHRIQCWDMTGTELPDIGDAKACLVAPRCKIHNDASVALGGGLLAALVPCGLLGASLCVYSLRPRGTLLHTWSFGANAISVSLSPMARYLVVGFAATRGYFAQEREVVAQIFKLTPPDTDGSSSVGGGQLQQVGNLSQPGGVIGQPPVSLNSVRWLPRPGEGLIYGTNRGSLCICRPHKPISKEDGGGRPTSRSGPTRDATSPFVMLTDQVDRTARNTTIQVLSTASQTVLPQTQTTGTQTMLRGSGLFVEQEQPVEDGSAAAASLVSSPSSEASDGLSAGPSTSGASSSSSSEASSTSWYSMC